MEPTYVFKAAGLRTLSAILVALFVIDFAIVIGLLIVGVPSWISLLFFVTVLPAAIIWLVIPRRFEVWRDRLVIVFPILVRWSIPFDTIASVEIAKWWHAYAFMGVRLASNPGRSVDIMRLGANPLRRPNIVITPENREEFIEYVTRALQRYRGR
jgi:hypothetical protein